MAESTIRCVIPEDGAFVVIEAPGDIDIDEDASFRSILGVVLAHEPRQVFVDLRDNSFATAPDGSELIWASLEARLRGVELWILVNSTEAVAFDADGIASLPLVALPEQAW